MLSNIFEYSPWIAEQVAAARPFAGVKQLFDAMKAAVDLAPAELRLALIKAHPDLANKTQRAAGLPPIPMPSRTASASTGCRMRNMPRSNGSTTPIVRNSSFPYIVCVRRHTKDLILRDFERRLPNDAKAEIQTSIAEICRIAALRLDQLVSADDKLPVHGRLSTHVLDTHSGMPAAGLRSSLPSSPSSAFPALSRVR